jgi:hypothetical protein
MPDPAGRTHRGLRTAGEALALGLIPLVACIAMMVVGFHRRDGDYMPVGVFVTGLPFLLAVVVVPSAVPIGIASGRWTKVATVAAMTAIAVVAGAINASADDSRAGLALAWVPTLAVPVAALVGAVRGLRAVSRRQAMD